MQGANKTINTKVGLDRPMSEQVRQRQVTLNEEKTLVNTKGVYGSKFGNETHFLSFAAIVATRNGTEGSLSRALCQIRALCPISGSDDSCKRQEMRLISKLGTVHPLGINERFSLIQCDLSLSDLLRHRQV